MTHRSLRVGIGGFAVILILLPLLTGVAKTCATYFSQLAYLKKDFWQPFGFRFSPFFPAGPKQIDLAFAGMWTDQKDSAMERLRAAYYEICFPCEHGPLQADPNATATRFPFVVQQQALKEALDSRLTPEEREEALLLEAKIAMRMGECSYPEQLLIAKDKLESFLRKAKDPGYSSEARGWLAHVHYLLGEYPAAAKIYIDELHRPESNLSRETLINSLKLVFQHKGHLESQLEEYFDTPRHALVVVNLLANFDRSRRRSARDVSRTASISRRLIQALHERKQLFREGEESDQLALTLMRCALVAGDPPAVLEFAGRLKTPPKSRETEYLWMRGSANFLLRRYNDAENDLWQLYRSPQASAGEKATAAAALIGVYEQLERPVDQLHCALLYELDEEDQTVEEMSGWRLPTKGDSLDLPFLLDVNLSIDQLREYLRRYPKPVSGRITTNWQPLRTRSTVEVVRYSLGVRYSRQENFEAAAREFQAVSALPRARRMRELAKLHADWKNARGKERKLQAQLKYASYLAAHGTQLFFNDLFWHGFQREALVTRSEDPRDVPPFTGSQYEKRRANERLLLDEQEERWRAFKLLDDIVARAGQTRLGRQAAIQALDCLVRISDRFGREDEIQASVIRLRAWLATGKSETR